MQHIFGSNNDMQRAPAAAQIRPQGFVATQGSETYRQNITTLNAASAVNATSFTTAAGGTATMKVGDVVFFHDPGAITHDESLVIATIPSGTNFTTTTGANQSHAITTTQLSVFGQAGSTQGAASTANGQRAG
jgi:hypothetical protein